MAIYNPAACLLGHDHFFALSEPFTYEAHLKVETLHPVLTPAHVLRIFVIDKFCPTVFADEDPTFVVCNLVRI
jgi:hypothetical protein